VPVFARQFYSGSNPTENGSQDYRNALRAELARSDNPEAVLRLELIAITKTITDGIRDLITKEKHVRHIVLNLGALPLATWAASLDKMSHESLPALKRRIADMELDLERGKIGGFPATMLLHGKPIFTTFAPFYDVVFSLAQLS